MGELWRAAAERRRRGRFEVLSPSADPEWLALSRAAHAAAVTSEAVTSEVVTSAAVTSEVVTSAAVTSEAVTSEVVTSEVVTSEAAGGAASADPRADTDGGYIESGDGYIGGGGGYIGGRPSAQELVEAWLQPPTANSSACTADGAHSRACVAMRWYSLLEEGGGRGAGRTR